MATPAQGVWPATQGRACAGALNLRRGALFACAGAWCPRLTGCYPAPGCRRQPAALGPATPASGVPALPAWGRTRDPSTRRRPVPGAWCRRLRILAWLAQRLAPFGGHVDFFGSATMPCPRGGSSCDWIPDMRPAWGIVLRHDGECLRGGCALRLRPTPGPARGTGSRDTRGMRQRRGFVSAT